jgi:CheY-like chemotaxis protein
VLAEVLSKQEEAEFAAAQKSRFLSNISHEVRTPITAILGFSEVLSDQKMAASERPRFAERISQNCSHLLGLIDSLMDLSKVQSGQLRQSVERIDLQEEFKTISDFCQLRAQERQLKFHLDLDASLMPWIEIDKVKFRQIILNLANNAFKFTLEGEVQIRCYRAEMGPVHNALVVEIQDTGVGVAEDFCQRIFEAFQARESESRSRFGGVGLGLHIAKSMAQFLGGDVVLLHSEVGVGSKFRFYTPTKWLTAPGSEAASATRGFPFNFAQRNILLVEDSVDLAELLALSFTQSHAQVTVAENGQQAVQFAAQQTFDLIIMDYEMPVMNGIKAIQTIRSQGSKVPIMMLTAYSETDRIDEGISAGANLVLVKPVMGHKLLAAADQLMRRKAATSDLLV